MNIMRMFSLQTLLTLIALLLVIYCLLTVLFDQCDRGHNGEFSDTNFDNEMLKMTHNHQHVMYDSNENVFYYGPNMPLIFVGGFPRSGTTLMRAMLDAHPDIRCGEETHVIPRILGLRSQWKQREREWKRLLEAGIDDYVIDSAVGSFILEIIAKHGQPAKVLCNKDPFALKSMEYLAQLFSNSKFVFMIRDGRGTVHSMISRGVGIGGFDLKNPRQCLETWNKAIGQMYYQCYLVGPERCFIMYYEQLVLQPEKWMKKLTTFLQVPWNQSVLHHEQFIGDEISLSKMEKSTDQVIKPVNTEALTKWVGNFPEDVVRDMAEIAPMLSYLGYDPDANPPNYDKASDFDLMDMADVVQNAKLWDINMSNPQPYPNMFSTEANNELFTVNNNINSK